jgi:hypothetical protein
MKTVAAAEPEHRATYAKANSDHEELTQCYIVGRAHAIRIGRQGHVSKSKRQRTVAEECRSVS